MGTLILDVSPLGVMGIPIGYCIKTKNRLVLLREEVIQEHIGEYTNFPFYIDFPEGGKVDPKEETKCFDLGEPAKITIYVEQPIEGSREITAALGHTFVGIQQNGIIRNIGFYPNNGGAANLVSSQGGEIHDNSTSKYNVSITTDITANQLSKIINFIRNYPKTYSLNSYNCSDFGLSVAKLGGLALPETVGRYGFLFKGRNPSDLGEDIRELKTPSNAVKDTKGGFAPKRTGDCE